VFAIFCDRSISITSMFGATPDDLLYMSSYHVQFDGLELEFFATNPAKFQVTNMPSTFSRSFSEQRNQTSWTSPAGVVSYKGNQYVVSISTNDYLITLSHHYDVLLDTYYLDIGVSLNRRVVASGILGASAAVGYTDEEFQRYQRFRLEETESLFAPWTCASF
jgi:hypothetical protein